MKKEGSVELLGVLSIKKEIDSKYRHYRGKSFLNYLEQFYVDRFNNLLRLYKEKKDNTHRKMLLKHLREMENKSPDVKDFICKDCRKKYNAVRKKIR